MLDLPGIIEGASQGREIRLLIAVKVSWFTLCLILLSI